MAGYTLPALVYLFAILLAAFRFSRGPMLFMAGAERAGWNFFFIPPRFTFEVRALEDIILLGMFFTVALSMGHLTTRLRTREIAERRRQIETDALLRVTQSAALAPETEKGLAEALSHHQLGDRCGHGAGRAQTGPLAADNRRTPRAPGSRPDHGIRRGRLELTPTSRSPGRFTDTLPQSAATWFPLQTATSVMGVLGLRLAEEDATLDFQRRADGRGVRAAARAGVGEGAFHPGGQPGGGDGEIREAAQQSARQRFP